MEQDRILKIKLSEAQKLYRSGDDNMKLLLLGSFTEEELVNIDAEVERKTNAFNRLIKAMLEVNGGFIPDWSNNKMFDYYCIEGYDHKIDVDTHRTVPHPFVFKDSTTANNFLKNHKDDLEIIYGLN